jgi:23S rRNA (uracil-5-)-methyltransferase RumA
LFHLNKLQDNLDDVFLPIVCSPVIDWYRNKVEFSFGKYISHKNNKEEHFNVWFHKQWEFSKIEDFDWCILIDEFQNKIYREIKNFCKSSWLPVYDSMKNDGFFRHILIRKTNFTKEMMIILWFNHKYFQEKKDLKKEIIKIEEFFKKLAEKNPEIKSIYLSYNSNKADIAIWDLKLIYWKESISETLHWLNFNISPKSFFQTNSSGAEKLYSIVLDFAHKEKLNKQKVLDLYAWTWTIWMIFSKAWAKEVTSVELVKSASDNWKDNAELNGLKNMNFVCAKVEDFLEDYLKKWNSADLLIIDPPRTWMHPDALPNILKFGVNQIIYVSCNPSTLTRDLWFILKNSNYKINKIQPMDMFPHTHHIETVVSLINI